MAGLLMILINSSHAHGQIKLDRLFPPVVSAGEESVIIAEGKFPKWPPNVYCDRGDVDIVAEKESGKLRARVAKGATSGVAWVRIHDEQSASSLIPLVISPIPVTVETEPNNKRSDANKLSLPALVAARLSKSGESDAYRVSIRAGQQIVASVTANQILKSPMDAVMQLTDVRGNVLIQSDDVRGLDPQIVYRARSDQDLLIRVFAFPETPNSTVGFGGSSAFVYTMHVTTGAFVDHIADADASVVPFGYNLGQTNVPIHTGATEVTPVTVTVEEGLGWAWRAPHDLTWNRVLFDGPSPVELPIVVSGHIADPKETHSLFLSATKGTKYRAEVRSKSDGFLLDSKLSIVQKATGKELASNDDVSRGRYDAGVDFSAKEDGDIEVRLSDVLDGFGPRHFYQLSIRRIEPAFRLSVAADHFWVTQDKPIEITVSVARDSGFNDKIRIDAEELPDGVTAEPVMSEPKGGTAKSVKLKLTAGQGSTGNGSFQIIGTALDGDDKPRGKTVKTSFPLRPAISLSRFWLTVPPSKSQKDSSEKDSSDKAKP